MSEERPEITVTCLRSARQALGYFSQRRSALRLSRRITRRDREAMIKVARLARTWFEHHGRSFPWRSKGVPIYRHIVCEVLLQRTKAESVAKLYVRLFSLYPDWASLAVADLTSLEDTLRPLGIWKRRAAVLKALGNNIVEHAGLPRGSEEISALPGVGQYVQNAILLFRDHANVPLIDSNMVRIVERVTRTRLLEDYRYDSWLQGLCEILVSGIDPITTNWAILDIGAMHCRQRAPLCESCPIGSCCNYAFRRHKIGSSLAIQNRSD